MVIRIQITFPFKPGFKGKALQKPFIKDFGIIHNPVAYTMSTFSLKDSSESPQILALSRQLAHKW
jgi:hypothetical protein